VNPKHFRVRAVLFDWDGTLLDSYDADARAYLDVFHELGVGWTRRELDRHYSPNGHRVYKAARIPRAMWRQADRMWLKAYEGEAPRLLRDVRNVLRRLAKKHALGLVTSGSRSRVRRQVRAFELAPLFAACVCAEDAPKRKPHPAALRIAMKRMRVKPRECVYIGDSAEDIEMAQRARVHAVGVLGPFPTAKRVRAARPEAILRSIRELPRYLERIS
jgi:HAD superfamily hydrolase (TIGR01509 family)